MLGLYLYAMAGLVVQSATPLADQPLDLRIALEIAADAAPLGELGPMREVAQRADFAGSLFVWAVAEDRALDLFVRVDRSDSSLWKEDDDSGGGNVPLVRLDVVPGDAFVVRVASKSRAQHGAFTLHLIAAPETEQTRSTAAAVLDAVARATELAQSQAFDAARQALADVWRELVTVDGARSSRDISEAVWRLRYKARELGDVALTADAGRWVRAWREHALPEDAHALQAARANLALDLKDLGDVTGARELEEQVLAVCLRTLPDDHPDLNRTRLNLATTLGTLGDARAARQLQEKVLEVRTRTLPDDHPDLQLARQNLAVTILDSGDVARARELFEKVLEVLLRTLPADHLDVQDARANLSLVLRKLGDLARVRALDEQVLEVRARALPADHVLVLRARTNLAGIMGRQGDTEGARSLFEEVLEALSRTLPDDHPELQTARLNLAVALDRAGDPSGARELLEGVLDARERTLPDTDPRLWSARQNMAEVLKQMGEHARARELQEQVLEACTRTLSDDHADLQQARQNLANTLLEEGSFAEGLALQRQALECLTRQLPDDHVDLVRARALAVAGLVRSGDAPGFTAMALDFMRGATAAFETLVRESAPREAESRAAHFSGAVSDALSFAGSYRPRDAGPELERPAFTLCESARSVGLASAALLRRVPSDAETAHMRDRARAASGDLARSTRAGSSRESLARARAQRDGAQRELLAHLEAAAPGAQTFATPTAQALAATLRSDEACVGYARYMRTEIAADSGQGVRAGDHLLAHIVRADGSLTRIELGRIEPIEAAVAAWRRDVGTAQSPANSRGTPAETGAPVSDAASGERVRRAIFDPLVASLDGVARIVVALDDVLHLIPLDALPEGASVLGSRIAIEVRSSLSERLWPAVANDREDVALLVGGVDFESDRDPAELSQDAGTPADVDSAVHVAPHVASVLRGGAWDHGFTPLLGTQAEVDGVSRLRDSRGDTLVLSGARARLAEIERCAPQARWLHVATHGWFAADSVKSTSDLTPLDAQTGLGVRTSLAEEVNGTTPMLLCGLALAGANLPPDALGHARGLVSAEEIASWDLAGCELAVLSACDTNVGLRRAGQGVASLQKALHMAGARSVITSLWKVPDVATKELMLDFYRRLWVEKKPKHQALWEAKTKLREAKDEGGAPQYTTRDWAAWVLTGDPD